MERVSGRAWHRTQGLNHGSLLRVLYLLRYCVWRSHPRGQTLYEWRWQTSYNYCKLVEVYCPALLISRVDNKHLCCYPPLLISMHVSFAAREIQAKAAFRKHPTSIMLTDISVRIDPSFVSLIFFHLCCFHPRPISAPLPSSLTWLSRWKKSSSQTCVVSRTYGTVDFYKDVLLLWRTRLWFNPGGSTLSYDIAPQII